MNRSLKRSSFVEATQESDKIRVIRRVWQRSKEKKNIDSSDSTQTVTTFFIYLFIFKKRKGQTHSD